MTTLNMPEQGAPASCGATQDLEGCGLRHELVDAQVQVLCSYLEKRPPAQLVVALDRLINCCRASFREEEELMTRLGGQIDPAHRERHEDLMSQLQQLRMVAMDSDRGRLLAKLILIDRELIAHVADAARAQGGDEGRVTSILPQGEARF